MLAEPPEPWRGFLAGIDRLLASQRSSSPIDLHCVGGFVVAMCYDLQRVTADIDVFEVVPGNALTMLLDAAGKGRPLARKHGVYIDAGSRVATLPQDYASRLTEIFKGRFAHLRLLVLDRYDLALSKLERNIDRDRDDVLLLARTNFDVAVLRERYRTEVRPFVSGRTSWHDQTIELWLEMIDETRNGDSPPAP
jgi:hypothetical protein